MYNYGNQFLKGNIMQLKDDKYFIFSRVIYETIKELPLEKKAQFIDMILNYGINKDIPTIKDKEDLKYFNLFKRIIDLENKI